VALIREHRHVRLTREVDIFVARELAAKLAEVNGFDSYQCADIETAVSELASNALRYGNRGWAILRIGPDGFEAVITDEGPGFGSAVETKSGLGVGLAGAERLMDEMTIGPGPVGGRVSVKKRKGRADSQGESALDWEISVVNRLRAGRSASGDSWWALPRPDSLTAAVVDGLGSGEMAARASAAVLEDLSGQNPEAPLEQMILSAHEAARQTRGAVGVVARITGSEVEYCGVGDAGGKVGPTGDNLTLPPGVLGVEISPPTVRRLPWGDGSSLGLWTDGLRPPNHLLSEMPATGLDDWIDDVAIEHGTDRDDGLLLIAARAESRSDR
jgi:anti-sigma regulatory factor (Ser/Thr protein kinase)